MSTSVIAALEDFTNALRRNGRRGNVSVGAAVELIGLARCYADQLDAVEHGEREKVDEVLLIRIAATCLWFGVEPMLLKPRLKLCFRSGETNDPEKQGWIVPLSVDGD